MSLLVTGGAGFIGSNFVRYYLDSRPDGRVVNLDALTYAGNLANLAPVEGDERHLFVKGDICDGELLARLFAEEKITEVAHFAAETHVDRSIAEPDSFLRTNVNGTHTLLEAARKAGVERFIHVSTDETYGSIAEGSFTEESPLTPTSPYSASKAGSDLLALSYYATYGMPVVVTRCSNNFGPYQFPEKLIPLFISNAMEDRELPVYGDGMNVRDWIYVDDHCEAVLKALEGGRPGEIYNIGGGNELPNLEVIDRILAIMDKPESLKRFVADRPGHDRRYSISSAKIERELGWKPVTDFGKALEETVNWYRDNRKWWEDIKSGEYMDYYKSQYGEVGCGGNG